jgi:hypothetical protein
VDENGESSAGCQAQQTAAASQIRQFFTVLSHGMRQTRTSLSQMHEQVPQLATRQLFLVFPSRFDVFPSAGDRGTTEPPSTVTHHFIHFRGEIVGLIHMRLLQMIRIAVYQVLVGC